METAWLMGVYPLTGDSTRGLFGETGFQGAGTAFQIAIGIEQKYDAYWNNPPGQKDLEPIAHL